MKTPSETGATDGKFVGIWIRVSTDEQAKGDSPKHHEIRARAYAQAKGWTVREVYDLAGFSGKSVIDYPETKRMMADVKRGHISGLIFSKLARFGRNTKELLGLSEFFQEHNADLISLQEAIDTSSPAGRLFFTVNAALAQFEREEIASRVAASVPIRAKLGKPLGGLSPYGYHWVDKKLVPHPENAAVRKLIYELFAEHKRKKTVVRMLNDKGLRTRSGKKWTAMTLDRIIADPSAKGEYRQNYTTGRGADKAWSFKPEHEWTITPVPPIVTAELWQACNALLEARKTTGKTPAKRGKSPLTGLVVCHCGKTMYIPYNTPKWVCYSCRNKIPAADMEELFRDELKAFMTDPAKTSEYLKKAKCGIEGKRELLSGLRKERDGAKGECDRCFELYQAGALSIAQFKERFQPLDQRKKEIEREIPTLEGEIAALSVDEVSFEHVATEGRSFYDNWPTYDMDKKRAVAEQIVRSIVVGKDDVSFNLFTLPSLEMVTERAHMGTDEHG